MSDANHKIAKKIATKILDHLNGRGGFEQIWAECDPDIQRDITDSLIEIIEDDLEFYSE